MLHFNYFMIYCWKHNRRGIVLRIEPRYDLPLVFSFKKVILPNCLPRNIECVALIRIFNRYMPCSLFHLAYGMFHHIHFCTRWCIANSPDIRSHHYCCGGYHLGCMPWYCDPWTFADTVGLVLWIGHNGHLIGAGLETSYRGVTIVLHRTIDWRLAALSR